VQKSSLKKTVAKTLSYMLVGKKHGNQQKLKRFNIGTKNLHD